MADTKITDFPTGGGVQLTDEFWAVRNGLDYRVNISSLQLLVSSPAQDNLLSMDANGQATNSGIAKSNVTTQGNAFNGNSQLMQTTADGKIPALYSGNTLVANPSSLTITALNTALENVYQSILQSDWTEANPASFAYIKNKPVLLNNPMTAAFDLIYGGTPVDGVAPPVRLPKGTANQILMVNAALSVLWADNPALYQYSKYRYVDNVGGNDSNIGSYNSPYKTMKYAVENNPTGMILVLMGQSTETPFTIPANKTNIDIVAFGTRSALNGFTNEVSIAGIGAGSVRFQNINFGAGLARLSTSTCGIYLYGGSIGATGFTQAGNGYTEFNDCDASNANNIITAGTFIANAGKIIAPTVSGTGTFVSLNNMGNIIGNSTAAVGSTFSCVLSIWVSASTGYAISSVANSVVLLDGVQYVRPDLATLAPISLVGNYSIQYTEFAKTTSTLTGTNLSSTDWFDNLGLLNAATVTGRTLGLVLDSTGKIAQQTLPVPGMSNPMTTVGDIIVGGTAGTPQRLGAGTKGRVLTSSGLTSQPTWESPANILSFNVPISTVYTEGAVPSNITLRNTAGTAQVIQNALLCNSNGLMTLSQLFSITVNTGQTLNINGRITFYNLNPITTPNYYVNIQVWGVTTGGQLVNLGTVTQTTLSKAQYAYTNAEFSATDTLNTNLVAIGINAQLLYGEADNTAIINTLFAQATITNAG